MCDGEEHHVPMVPRLFIKVRKTTGQHIRPLHLHCVYSSFGASEENFVRHSNFFQVEPKNMKLSHSNGTLTKSKRVVETD